MGQARGSGGRWAGRESRAGKVMGQVGEQGVMGQAGGRGVGRGSGSHGAGRVVAAALCLIAHTDLQGQRLPSRALLGP